MKQSTELSILPEREKAIDVYSKENGLAPFLQIIRDELDAFIHDTSTAKGRKEIASMSAKVSKSKVALDDLGKELVSELKEKPKLIDAERKRMRDLLDTWRDDTRKPLTDWEAEQERIEAEKQAAIEAEKLAAQKESDHEIAILLNEKFDREATEAKAEAERQRIAYEADIAKKAAEQAIAEERQRNIDAENARIAAQAKVEADRIAEQQRKDDEARANAARLEREKAEAEQRVIDAENRAKKAIDDERARVEHERALAEQEQARIEQDKKHIGMIRKQSKEDLMLINGVSEDIAKAVILAIHSKQIRNLSIKY